MATIDREAIYLALLARVWAAYAWKNPLATARRVKLWGDVPLEMRPALYQFEGGDETYAWKANNAQPTRTLPANLFVYFDAKAPESIGASQINAVMDALDTALQVTGGDIQIGRCTLGGLVYSCRIDGPVFKDPGDLDGDGMLNVPISIVVP